MPKQICGMIQADNERDRKEERKETESKNTDQEMRDSDILSLIGTYLYDHVFVVHAW